ncbi:ABC transporter ATP-binding protein [Piscinibacter defluvii]|uniref:ABC transporter ATP-binding protein n=1 Tax=Piscinibacter defluvii TaxID=1796922 RepID=UPI000FDEB003|nr:ABC transporter ATP-binding protein [Piscinibacter defluvii]
MVVTRERIAMSVLELEGVEKRFGNGLLALQGTTLSVAAGEFVTILGPSGCGKSTVLKLAAGLEPVSAGRIDAPALRDRRSAQTAYVFQEPTLMPWASVFDNVWLPLRLAGMGRDAAHDRIERALNSVGLLDFASAFPGELSGGMKMRVSIARALVTEPLLLLMDEPFAALDEITRQKLNADLLASWQSKDLATLFVTHSVYESVFLSQRVLVMSARPGHIIAELAIDEPYPRTPAFRTSPAYLAHCRTLTDALEAAHVPQAA